MRAELATDAVPLDKQPRGRVEFGVPKDTAGGGVIT